MKLDEAIAWLTTEGQFDTEGHCCPKSSEAINTLLDALRNGAIFTFEEVVPKAFHDRCMQIEIAKRRKVCRILDDVLANPNCGAIMEGDEENDV